MKPLIRILALILCLVTVLWGCHRTTTVILPPETTSSGNATTSATQPTTAAGDDTTAATNDPAGSTETSVVETTEAPTAPFTGAPSENPTSRPTAEPSTAPTSAPTEGPTFAPTTEPTTVPTSAPTEEPSSAPATEPTTAPTSAPTEEPSSAPTTAPTTAPTAPPATEPTAAPETNPEPTQHPVYDISDHAIGSLEYSLHAEVNLRRTGAEAPLPELTLDRTLCALAAIRAYECAESFSSTRPDGRSGLTVLSDYDYWIWSQAEERLHNGTSGLAANLVVKAWMYNDAFSASILSSVNTHIGIGVYDTGSSVYIVCIFAG